MWLRWVLGVCLYGLVTCWWAEAAEPRPAAWAVPLETVGVPNFCRINGQLYRSGQPSAPGFQALEKQGIREVLDLRLFHDDRALAAGTGLAVHSIPVNAGDFGEREMVAALQVIATARSPVLVHCLHGSDRTGAVIAMYRVVCEGWSKQQALDELQRGGYGYHTFFSNIPAFIREVDVAAVRRQVSGAGCPAGLIR